jgi:hypothetical protein
VPGAGVAPLELVSGPPHLAGAVPAAAPIAAPAAAGTAAERQRVLGVLHAERFWDAAPASVYATLLDEGTYL